MGGRIRSAALWTLLGGGLAAATWVAASAARAGFAAPSTGPADVLLAAAWAAGAAVLARTAACCAVAAATMAAAPGSCRATGVVLALAPRALRPLVVLALSAGLGLGVAGAALASSTTPAPAATTPGQAPAPAADGDGRGTVAALPQPGWRAPGQPLHPLPTAGWVPPRHHGPSAPALSLVTSGSADRARDEHRDEPAASGIVVVRRGDCLWTLAARHLGPGASPARVAAQWPRWWQANRARIGADPDLLLPGTRLRVPSPTAGGSR